MATIDKIFSGGTRGHSDGKVVYRASRSEIEKYPWWKAAIKDLGLVRIIQVVEDYDYVNGTEIGKKNTRKQFKDNTSRND